MKKLILSIFAFAAFASCKKDRTCTCTGGGSTETITIVHSTKHQAQANCMSTKETINGFVVEKDCTLK
jgi:hypothetical protein